ncbi:MAG: hypothetical protein IT304_10140 [Dehalococcoidia bacterium]|nr:hypothetical protein [Dehalococcoidia bacterium]
MYTNPSAARVLECIQESLEREILPELQSDKARVTLAMIQTMLTSVERRVPVEQQWMADECNRMNRTMQACAGALDGVDAAAAAAYRTLAAAHAAREPFPALPAFATLNETYRQQSDDFVEGLGLLNALVGEGVEAAAPLLQQARAYVQLRIERDMAGLFAMEGGMVGRG